ncbi:MAG: acetyl-CoA C-acyltransferase [Alphaproteobacteria bacterium]|nr:MAG: acetyl-CoA C-acyltransferase [Alphaproteobacteria bacterium]
MTTSDPIVIVGAARTPMGGFQGALAGKTGPELGADAVRAAVARAGVAGDDIDEVVMGCVLSAGLGQAPARQAAIFGGLPESTPCTTVNKMCGSGMRATMTAADTLALGHADIMVAGGLESMTNAPYILPKVRDGLRLGHGEVKDHMFLDGLEDAYEHRLMGTFAEETAQHFQFTREAQDAFAVESLRRAKQATEDGSFAGEIEAITIKTRKGEVTVSQDEQPLTADPEKIPTLRPAFAKDGSVTAANSSSISDGAAALVLTRASVAEARGLTPLARIVGQASHARAPRWFTTAPVGAMQSLFEKIGWSKDDVDLYEINEAFAVVSMAAMHEMDLPHDKVNVHGGACALGHPIGASGARILVTLLAALEKYDQKRGVASLCIGGGEATAVAIERLA